ncbi:unnamed protein product [Toxocara canis]|uniref:Uncharacterized protein n=1 Tax=Toxocara canis TaxID=6265 RepID=A0A3P7H6S9_TOXCA|nr:unnamed protein product [Toxocara canis]
MSKALTWPKRYWAEMGCGYLRMHRLSKNVKSGRSPTDGIVVNIVETTLGFDDTKCRIHLVSRADLDYFCPTNKADYGAWKAAIGYNRCYKPTHIEENGSPNSCQMTAESDPIKEASNTDLFANAWKEANEMIATGATKEGNSIRTAGVRKETDEKKVKEDSIAKAHAIKSDSLVKCHSVAVRKIEGSHESDKLRPSDGRESGNETMTSPHACQITILQDSLMHGRLRKECECEKLCIEAKEQLEKATNLLRTIQRQQDQLNCTFEKVMQPSDTGEEHDATNVNE